MKKAKIISVNISLEKGTAKTATNKIELIDTGIMGDAHAGQWHRQVSLLAIESIVSHQLFSKDEYVPGVYAENITTEGLALHKLHVGERLSCRNVILEVSQIGKKCHGTSCSIFKASGDCIMPREGIFCRVIAAGELSPGDYLIV